MHSHMEHGQVYYIHVKPYVHELSVQTLMDRFLQTPALRSTTGVNPAELQPRVAKFMQRFSATHVPKDPMEQEIDRIISKKIMEHLNEFFKGSDPNFKMQSRITMSRTMTMKHHNYGRAASKPKTMKKNR